MAPGAAVILSCVSLDVCARRARPVAACFLAPIDELPERGRRAA